MQNTNFPDNRDKTGEIVETIKDGKLNRTMSCCNEDLTTLTQWCTPNFCPNCGAKIVGKKYVSPSEARLTGKIYT